MSCEWAMRVAPPPVVGALGVAGARVLSMRRKVPQWLTWIWYAPKIRVTPECRSEKVGLREGRWALNPRDSNRLDLVAVAEPMSVGDDETAEIAFPTCVVPTDGAN